MVPVQGDVCCNLCWNKAGTTAVAQFNLQNVILGALSEEVSESKPRESLDVVFESKYAKTWAFY
jgi:hypothetical protein